STGAGQSPSRTSHFSWRNNNISAYKIFSHQHLGEINQSLNQLQPTYRPALNFIPIRGNHTRGIYVTAYTKFAGSLAEAQKIYNDYYKNEPFVFILDEDPDLKQVVNTNKCFLNLVKHEDKLLIISVTDNLVKGASGQAVQNMNLMFGLDEKSGLYMKPSAF
ncbi:MAG: N-acetyl-gamma-glutamyl-phosphate reductase, partial [Prolixibacteraceae bacterium]|nr:N-acetyl-gamma-glutamyl-phosphate reductase [Prolixibacteraceae bacterium]